MELALVKDLEREPDSHLDSHMVRSRKEISDLDSDQQPELDQDRGLGKDRGLDRHQGTMDTRGVRRTL